MTRSLCGIVFATALLTGIGCSDEDPDTENTALFDQLNQSTDFRLDETSYDANQYEVATLASGGDVLTVAARGVSFTCPGGDPNKHEIERAFRADIHISNPAALSLGMPIDVGDPAAPIQAELSALAFEDPCFFWEGGAQGTVTIDSIELHGNPADNVIRGSFDLRAGEALPKCEGGEPKVIEIQWTNFEPMNASRCK